MTTGVSAQVDKILLRPAITCLEGAYALKLIAVVLDYKVLSSTLRLKYLLRPISYSILRGMAVGQSILRSLHSVAWRKNDDYLNERTQLCICTYMHKNKVTSYAMAVYVAHASV